MVILADIFAVLLRYFWSSIENLIINRRNDHLRCFGRNSVGEIGNHSLLDGKFNGQCPKRLKKIAT